MSIDIAYILESMPHLIFGAWVSIAIAGMSCLIGIILGTIIGFASTSNTIFIRLVILLYTTIIRGTPMLIQILFMYYALPQIAGISLSAFWAAVIAIGINSSAYISATVRSGINAVPIGQKEAAQVLGFSRLQTIIHIIIPQALKVIFPSLGNEFITLIKDSSLASIIGAPELTRQAGFIMSRSFDYLSIYTAVAVMYLVLTSALSLVLFFVERRMNEYADH